MIFDKNALCQKKVGFPELLPLFKGLGRAFMGPYGPIWAHMDPRNLNKYADFFFTRGL